MELFSRSEKPEGEGHSSLFEIEFWFSEEKTKREQTEFVWRQ
ncbi:hypothetical protein [Providencia sp. PROV007]|nr:hypothetical protein [Providencia sp. PROV007]